MGCCISHEQVSTIEVVLDQNGVARRVAAGKGTHLITTSLDKETTIERKFPTKPSELSNLSRPEAAYYYPEKCLMMIMPSPTTNSKKKVYPTVVTGDGKEKN